MKTCFIIINYNGLIFLQKYLERISIFCKKNNIYLLITDDKSTDSSISYLKINNFNYTINNRSTNGFASNVNNGMEFANKYDNFDYYIIANNDIAIREDFHNIFFYTIEHIRKNFKNVGLIGFDEINEDRVGHFNSFSNQSFNIEKIKSVENIPGFFFIITKELFDTIGFFDEEYFMYGEDNDYYERTKKARYKIIQTFLPVMHYSEGSSNNNKRTSWYAYRNALLFAQKNLGFFGVYKTIGSLLNQIYNPFHKDSNPSILRIKRNGFFYNNFFLFKSIIWNLKYYLKKKFCHAF
jgi:GT2 family glycosyltransferase